MCSLSLPNAEKGLEFLLKPDFSKVTGDVFWVPWDKPFLPELGDGMSLHLCLLFWKRDKVGEYGVECRSHRHICCSIGRCHYFPAAFSVGIQPDAGPSLIFITLPNVFQQAFSGIPFLAYVFLYCSMCYWLWQH